MVCLAFYILAVSSVHTIQRLNHVFLTGDNISDSGLTDLSEALMKNSTLMVLDLSGFKLNQFNKNMCSHPAQRMRSVTVGLHNLVVH